MATETEFTDQTPMPFGRHKGKPMIQVPAKYLLYLHNDVCSHAGVRKYIQDNLNVLKKEAEGGRR